MEEKLKVKILLKRGFRDFDSELFLYVSCKIYGCLFVGDILHYKAIPIAIIHEIDKNKIENFDSGLRIEIFDNIDIAKYYGRILDVLRPDN